MSSEPSKTSRDLCDRDSGKLKSSYSGALSDILVLPCAVPETNKPALNAKAVCITNDSRKEDEKAIAKKEKRFEREHKKKTISKRA